jgi:hypothetical protein
MQFCDKTRIIFFISFLNFISLRPLLRRTNVPFCNSSWTINLTFYIYLSVETQNGSSAKDVDKQTNKNLFLFSVFFFYQKKISWKEKEQKNAAVDFGNNLCCLDRPAKPPRILFAFRALRICV